ncbi:FUSC family protein [Stutzerimonas kunmingensis]|uniref:FUSC family protein n=1 Tax=Stutzerimonas kunmingensis TaxID=1211807 RepID=UPI0028AD7140|nr:FUSC family protein [Stutzerimonas kunmingensis]
MNMPNWREWLFSAKALITALLALYIALAMPLENPYWAMASVYVVSHPLSGATRSKAIYRALGTLLGAAASVVLLPTFAQQPVMLSLAISLWIGALLFLSLLDRSPRSYIFLLAAYTVPLISLAEVNHPSTIFDVALARSEEILLGIVCASVVNAVLFPSRIAPTLAAKMHLLLRDGRGAVSRMLNTQHLGEADQHALNALLVDVMGLDAMISHLSHDSSSYLSTVHAREFRARMAMLMPQLISTADSRHRLQAELQGLLPELVDYLQQVDRWIQSDAEAGHGEHLRDRSLQLAAWLGDSHPAHALEIDSGLRQLRALIDLWQDCLDLYQQFHEGHPEAAPALRYHVQQLVGGPRHYDYGLLAFTAASVALSVFCLSMLWFVSGWEHGYSGVFIAAVAGCFFASQDNPAPFIKSFLVATLISSTAAGVYLFALMPNVHDFGSLAILLALPLLLLGTLAGRPQHAGTVIVIAVQTISNITLQDSYRADFQLFADIALSTALGVLFAFVWARLTRPFGTLWAARRLVRHGWLSLAALADLRRWRNEADDASSFIDRIAQLLPRLAQLDDDRLALNDATRELRVGFRLLELRELRPAPAIEQKLEPVLGMIRAHFLACATARSQLPAPEPLHDALEAALQDLQRDASPIAHQAAQVVHGLRLALFADASASVRAAPGGPPPAAGLSLAGAHA